jgi:mRNA-degrading endonuclease HigB of HigAB toxin-antitoxin module
MRWFFIFCSILFLSGCCGSEVVLRKVEVKSPGVIDTLKAQEFRFKFKDINSDSLIEVTGYRGISFKEGSTDTAAITEFIPALNKFIIKMPERVDTVLIQDAIRVKPTNVIIRGNDNSERLIWNISFTLTTIFIIIYKRYLNDRKPEK